MARNIEIKARVCDAEALEALARTLSDQGPFDLEQDDTFFACPNGRLKLRMLSPDQAELIFYQRPNVSGLKVSSYLKVPVAQPALMRAALAHSLGVVGRVRKRRRVYLAGNTRIHLDQVQGLGSFLELEVVLEPSQPPEEGEAVARRLLAALGVSDTDRVPRAYLDLLAEAQHAERASTARAPSTASAS
jgi:predicted adenylyl cyclase CyaB